MFVSTNSLSILTLEVLLFYHLKGNEQKGAKHPDSISLEDLVFRDAQSIRASDKDSLINVMKFKRKEF